MSKEELVKIRDENIARHYKKYNGGHISEEKLQELIDFENKNFESGGKLYAERLAKALTPNSKWYK